MPMPVALPASTVGPETTIPIVRLGRPAAAALRDESRWEVRAVFRRSFYCRRDGGVFVCLGPLALGSGPLNVLYRRPEPIDWEAAGLAVGSSARCDGITLCVAERFTFSLFGAQTWCPAGSSVPRQPTAMKASVAELASHVRAWPARGGLHALIPMLTGEVPPPTDGVRAAAPLLRMAMDGIEPLKVWLECCAADPVAYPPAPGPALDALIGLGPGLTPSGDDFLGGLLVALRHFGAHDVARCLASDVLRCAGERTNDISRAHLAAAAEGEGLAALHDILARLGVAGAFRDGACLAAIDAIGHTSGWDALAGVMFAAAVMARLRAREEILAST